MLCSYTALREAFPLWAMASNLPMMKRINALFSLRSLRSFLISTHNLKMTADGPIPSKARESPSMSPMAAVRM